MQNGVDHGSLRPDLDVAATAGDITGMMLAAVIGSLRSGHDSDARARLRDAGRRRSEPADFPWVRCEQRGRDASDDGDAGRLPRDHGGDTQRGRQGGHSRRARLLLSPKTADGARDFA